MHDPTSMVEPDRLLRLLGETLREIGILVAVFAPLDALFADRFVSQSLVIAVMVSGALVIACGILIEARE